MQVVGSMAILDGMASSPSPRASPVQVVGSMAIRDGGAGCTALETTASVVLASIDDERHLSPHADGTHSCEKAPRQREEDTDSDSDHFDLTNLETPREECAKEAPEQHDLARANVTEQLSLQPEEEPGSNKLAGSQTGAIPRSDMQNQATVAHPTVAPVPPPRQRSRSITPPSDHDDHFQVRHKKHKARKRQQAQQQVRATEDLVNYSLGTPREQIAPRNGIPEDGQSPIAVEVQARESKDMVETGKTPHEPEVEQLRDGLAVIEQELGKPSEKHAFVC